MREGCVLGDSSGTLAEELQEIATGGLTQLCSSSHCMPERYVVGEGPWIIAGNTEEVALAKYYQLEFYNHWMWERHAVQEKCAVRDSPWIASGDA